MVGFAAFEERMRRAFGLNYRWLRNFEYTEQLVPQNGPWGHGWKVEIATVTSVGSLEPVARHRGDLHGTIVKRINMYIVKLQTSNGFDYLSRQINTKTVITNNLKVFVSTMLLYATMERWVGAIFRIDLHGWGFGIILHAS